MSMSLRVVAALSAGLLAAACGGSSTPAVPTTAKADAASKAILLTTADLPAGFTGAAHVKSTDGKVEDKEFASCVGASVPNSDDITDTYSDDFSKGNAPLSTEVGSEVQVERSAKVAASDAAAFHSSKVAPCLETFVSKLLSSSAGTGVTFSKPAVVPIDVASDGIDSAYGYTVTTTATTQGQSFPFEVTFVGLLRKHTKVSFTAVAIGQVLAPADRDAMVATLRTRTHTSAV